MQSPGSHPRPLEIRSGLLTQLPQVLLHTFKFEQHPFAQPRRAGCVHWFQGLLRYPPKRSHFYQQGLLRWRHLLGGNPQGNQTELTGQPLLEEKQWVLKQGTLIRPIRKSRSQNSIKPSSARKAESQSKHAQEANEQWKGFRHWATIWVIPTSRATAPWPAAPRGRRSHLKGVPLPVPPDYTWLDSKLIKWWHSAHTFPLISLRNYSKWTVFSVILTLWGYCCFFLGPSTFRGQGVSWVTQVENVKNTWRLMD